MDGGGRILRSVKPGRTQGKGSRRAGKAPAAAWRIRARRWMLGLALPALAVAGLQGAAALGLAPSAGDLARQALDSTMIAMGMSVSDVRVSGRRNSGSAEILTALNVGRGTPMLAFDVEKARLRVLDVDWVREATVTRLFPDAIHVAIVERDPFAVWRRGGSDYVIDENGATITEANPVVLKQLPYLVGEGAPDAAAQLFAVLKVRPSIGDRVRAAVRVGERRWTLKLDDGIEVMLPATGVEVALDELIRLDDRTGLLARDVRAVDLRIPDRLTVRTREDEADNGRKDART